MSGVTRKAFSECKAFSARWRESFCGRFIIGRNEETGQEIEMLPQAVAAQWERDGILPALSDFAQAASDRDWAGS